MLVWVDGLPTTLVDVLKQVQPHLVDDPANFNSDSATPVPGQRTSCTKVGPHADNVPLVRYLAAACLQTNYLPLDRIRCPACGDKSITRVVIPDEVAQAGGPLSPTTPEPALYSCVCGQSSTETQLVDAWLTEVHADDSAPPDDHVFSRVDPPGEVVTNIDGIDDAAWAIGLNEADLARLAHRSAEFQSTFDNSPNPLRCALSFYETNVGACSSVALCENTLHAHTLAIHAFVSLPHTHAEHLHTHTLSCFKNGKKKCRYGFPADDDCEAHVRVVWTVDGAALPLPDRRVEHVDRLDFVPARAESAPFCNRHNPTLLMSFPINTDFAVVASSPGITHYITSYSTKSQADCPKKCGHNALSGLHRALRTIERRRKEREDALPSVAAAAAVVGMTQAAIDEANTVRDARTLLSATLNNSVNHLVVMSPMAAYNLLYDRRFVSSHEFQSLNLNDAVKWVAGAPVSFRMQRIKDGDETNWISGVSDVQHYCHRGAALDDLSL